jgi:hypothetical protein
MMAGLSGRASIIMGTCESHDCTYVRYCGNSAKNLPVNKETKKGIANSVARLVCDDWQLFSLSSLLESDGKRLETVVHAEQSSKGFCTCFKSPY